VIRNTAFGLLAHHLTDKCPYESSGKPEPQSKVRLSHDFPTENHAVIRNPAFGLLAHHLAGQISVKE